MKKLSAVLVAVCLVASLALVSCSKGKTTAATGSDGKFPAGTKVVMAFMNWSGTPKGVDRISKAISAITEERYGITVELQILDIAAYSQNIRLMLAAGEKVDIFTSIGIGYQPAINNGYALDLEENDLIQTYGKDILKVVDPAYIAACRVDGTLYGLPQMRDMAIGLGGFAIPAEYLDKIGFDYNSMYKPGDEVVYADMSVIEDIFARLHKAYPDKYVISPQETTFSAQGALFDAVGGDLFGVLLDPKNSLKVENYFTSKVFEELVRRYYRWNQLGYISKDALTDTLAATQAVKAGTAMCYQTATKPGIRAQESGLCGMPVVIFQTGEDFMKSSAVASMPWCFNSNTDVPEAAMTVMNALFADKDLSNLICWSEEGKEWKFASDGQHITFADGVDPMTSEYYNNVNWLMPNQFIANIWEGDSLDVWERMNKFNNESVKSKALGFSFDSSAVAAEYTALNNVYSQYFLALCYGFTNPDTGIPEFENALKKAGLDKYMTAKQTALDAWAKANGVK